MGCPSGVGPEVTLRAAFEKDAPATVIVGDRGALVAAALASGISDEQLASIRPFDAASSSGVATRADRVQLFEPNAPLTKKERVWGKPSAAGGLAQLLYVEEGYRLAQRLGVPLVTAPVSKEAIARSGLARARHFRGHTEWLEELDGAPYSVMCFASSRLVTSLVTTHVPLAKVPRLLTAELVCRSIVELADLTLRLGHEKPILAVSSLNPHAGEGELLGTEETKAILPGIELARHRLGRRVTLIGPIGAETAYRKGATGVFTGVVAMYHDQATIPMKLLDFGGGVNVTQGLGIVRTSVDHGTAYDIAGRGVADPRGMREAMRVAGILGQAARRVSMG